MYNVDDANISYIFQDASNFIEKVEKMGDLIVDSIWQWVKNRLIFLELIDIFQLGNLFHEETTILILPCFSLSSDV